MQLFRIIPLEKDLWAINEIDKTVMYVINGTERALLLDTGLGLTDLKEEVLKLCGEKSLIVVNTHAHVDHNSGNYQFEEVCVGRYEFLKKRDFRLKCGIPDRQEKSVQSGMGISLIWEIKNLKFWKFPVIPWGVLHCLRRRKDGFLQEISCSPGKCGDI